MKDVTINTSALSLFRFLAILTVIAVHFATEIENFYLFPFGITRAGSIITFFFLLSGFGLYLGYQKRDRIDLRQFFFKRTIRLLPFYYLALLLMGALLFLSHRFSLTEFFLALFCIQPWLVNYQHAINPPGWFVADLLFFYAVFPGIFYLLKKIAPKPEKLLLGSVIFWLFMLVLHNGLLARLPASSYSFIDCFPLSWFCSFYMGICGAYFIKSQIPKSRFIVNDSVFYSLLILLLCSAIMFFQQGRIAELIEAKLPFEANFYAPLFLLLILNFSTANNYLTKLLSLRFFGLLATISYPLYILQAPVHSIYSFLIGKQLSLSPELDFSLFLLFFLLLSSGLTYAEIRVFDWLGKRTSGQASTV